MDNNNDGDISEDELNKAIDILTKAKKQREVKNRQRAFENFQNKLN